MLKYSLRVKSSYLNRVLSKLIAEVGRRQVGFFVADGRKVEASLISLSGFKFWIKKNNKIYVKLNFSTFKEIHLKIQTNAFSNSNKYVSKFRVGFFVADGSESGSLSQWIIINDKTYFNIQTNTFQN